jgi:hypothetical protein
MAPIYAPTISSVSPCRVRAAGTKARIEPEIEFVIGYDLPRRTRPYSDGQITLLAARMERIRVEADAWMQARPNFPFAILLRS